MTQQNSLGSLTIRSWPLAVLTCIFSVHSLNAYPVLAKLNLTFSMICFVIFVTFFLESKHLPDASEEFPDSEEVLDHVTKVMKNKFSAVAFNTEIIK